MNAFESYADVAKPPWERRKEASIAKRRDTVARKSAVEERLDERDLLTKLYRQHVAERKAELLAGPHGQNIKSLLSFMRRMTPASAPALIEIVEHADWLKQADQDTRYGVLNLIDRGIMNLRKREGLQPFDDALPGEPPAAFETIRDLIGVR